MKKDFKVIMGVALPIGLTFIFIAFIYHAQEKRNNSLLNIISAQDFKLQELKTHQEEDKEEFTKYKEEKAQEKKTLLRVLNTQQQVIMILDRGYTKLNDNQKRIIQELERILGELNTRKSY